MTLQIPLDHTVCPALHSLPLRTGALRFGEARIVANKNTKSTNGESVWVGD